MKREQGRGAAAAEMLPPLVDLGTFAAERENTFVLPVSEAVQAWTEIDGMAVRTEVSAAGEHILRLTLPAMRTGVLLYGALVLRGPQGERTVHLTGRAAELFSSGSVTTGFGADAASRPPRSRLSS